MVDVHRQVTALAAQAGPDVTVLLPEGPPPTTTP